MFCSIWITPKHLMLQHPVNIITTKIIKYMEFKIAFVICVIWDASSYQQTQWYQSIFLIERALNSLRRVHIPNTRAVKIWLIKRRKSGCVSARSRTHSTHAWFIAINKFRTLKWTWKHFFTSKSALVIYGGLLWPSCIRNSSLGINFSANLFNYNITRSAKLQAACTTFSGCCGARSPTLIPFSPVMPTQTRLCNVYWQKIVRLK